MIDDDDDGDADETAVKEPKGPTTQQYEKAYGGSEKRKLPALRSPARKWNNKMDKLWWWWWWWCCYSGEATICKVLAWASGGLDGDG